MTTQHILTEHLYFSKGGISSNVQNAIGESMTFERLKHILMQSGINLFPDDDAFCYCESIIKSHKIKLVDFCSTKWDSITSTLIERRKLSSFFCFFFNKH